MILSDIKDLLTGSMLAQTIGICGNFSESIKYTVGQYFK